MKRLPFLISLCLAAPLGAEAGYPALSRKCLQARAREGAVRVLHFGDSHVASGGQTGAWRTMLRASFGDGGPGFGLPWAGLGLPGIRAGATPGWMRQAPSARGTSDGLAGPSGAWIEARSTGERAWLEGSFRRARLYLLRQPGGGRLRPILDGLPAAPAAELDGAPEVVRVDLEAGAGKPHRLELAAEGGKVRILGLALENGPGVVYSALGHNGATAAWLLQVQEGAWERILRDEAPDLVILAFGTNEATLRDYGPDPFRRDLAALLDRLRRILPGAALLLTAPPDADLPGGKSPALEPVIRIQRELAAKAGALFLDTRAAMGGPGSIFTWLREGLAARDRIHFTPAGYGRLARLGLEGLFRRLELETGRLSLEPSLAQVAAGAFAPPAVPTRLPSSALPVPEPAAAMGPRPIYTFRTEAGRLIITDNPQTVEGQKGVWIGAQPRT